MRSDFVCGLAVLLGFAAAVDAHAGTKAEAKNAEVPAINFWLMDLKGTIHNLEQNNCLLSN